MKRIDSRIDTKDISSSFPLALIVSRYHEELSQKLLDGALTRLRELKFKEEHLTVVMAPGAIEIPIIAQRLSESGLYDALIAMGIVIEGETDHYQYVCDLVSEGCLRVSLQNDIPVIFSVLTVKDEAQALARLGGAEGHKGIEAVDAVVSVISVLGQIS